MFVVLADARQPYLDAQSTLYRVDGLR